MHGLKRMILKQIIIEESNQDEVTLRGKLRNPREFALRVNHIVRLLREKHNTDPDKKNGYSPLSTRPIRVHIVFAVMDELDAMRIALDVMPERVLNVPTNEPIEIMDVFNRVYDEK